jgi:hypothetical protein
MINAVFALVAIPGAFLVRQHRFAAAESLANGGGYADLVVEPSPITSHLKPGGRAEQTITIQNRTSKPVHFTKYETSCECVSLKWPEDGVSIEPNQSVSLTVVVDMSDDPQYVGSFGRK